MTGTNPRTELEEMIELYSEVDDFLNKAYTQAKIKGYFDLACVLHISLQAIEASKNHYVNIQKLKAHKELYDE